MDADEVALLVVVFKSGSGGAVGLVADDEIQPGQAVLFLGAADDIQAVVGGEDDAHVRGVVPFGDFEGEAPRIRGGGVAQLVGEGLDDVLIAPAALFAHLGIGADGEAVQGDGALLGPLGEGLGEQVQGGHEEEDELVFPRLLLGDLQGSEGLAGAAGHDELPPVRGLEAEADLGPGRGLMRAELLLGLEDRGLAGLVFGPVNLGVLQVVKVQLEDGGLLLEQGVLGVLAPVIGGGDDEALGEGLPPRGGEEAVNVPPHDAVVLVVAFALDGVVFVRAARLRDEVNAGVPGADAELGRAGFPGPIREEPHVGVKAGVAGLVAEVGADELLEVAALFALGLGGGAVLGKEALERRGGHGAESSRRRAVVARALSARRGGKVRAEAGAMRGFAVGFPGG